VIVRFLPTPLQLLGQDPVGQLWVGAAAACEEGMAGLGEAAAEDVAAGYAPFSAAGGFSNVRATNILLLRLTIRVPTTCCGLWAWGSLAAFFPEEREEIITSMAT
jgi:hypothetical protein